MNFTWCFGPFPLLSPPPSHRLPFGNHLQRDASHSMSTAHIRVSEAPQRNLWYQRRQHQVATHTITWTSVLDQVATSVHYNGSQRAVRGLRPLSTVSKVSKTGMCTTEYNGQVHYWISRFGHYNACLRSNSPFSLYLPHIVYIGLSLHIVYIGFSLYIRTRDLNIHTGQWRVSISECEIGRLPEPRAQPSVCHPSTPPFLSTLKPVLPDGGSQLDKARIHKRERKLLMDVT